MAVQITHYRDLDIEYGRVDQVRPLIRRVTCRNPTPFTFKGTGTFIVGTGQVAIIDPGPNLDAHLEATMAALGPDESVTHVFITHTHSDHSPGATWVKERTGAVVYGFGPHGKVGPDDPTDKVDFSKYFTAEEKTRYDKEYEDLDPALKREGPDLKFQPDVRMGDGDVVEGETWRIRAVWTPGHCSNHLCFELAEERALFTGDHVMGWATSVVGPPDGSMRDYLASLRKLLALDDVDAYFPTHGPEVPNPREYVSSFLAHRTEREEQILAFLGEGPKEIADFVPAMYAGYDKRLWYPAANSVYAHVLGMVEDGRVVVDGGGDPKLRSVYRLAA
jgi:glyoxylase-like metal-dependent hydrolase (beta-lactamase superfamily II)